MINAEVEYGGSGPYQSKSKELTFAVLPSIGDTLVIDECVLEVKARIFERDEEGRMTRITLGCLDEEPDDE